MRSPLNVFVPDRVRVPAPAFVTPPFPVVTAPMEVVPTPSIVSPASDPVTPAGTARVVPESTWISADPPSVTCVDTVFEPEELRTAPPDVTPEPVIVNGSPMVMPPVISSAPPEDTVVPVEVAPNDDALVIFTVPPEIAVAPVKSLAVPGDRVNVPAADLETAPAPVIFPVSTWSDDEPTAKVVPEPSVTRPAYDLGVPDPNVPVNDNVPAEIVVAPLNVFVPDSVNVPSPDFVSAYEPDTAPETVPVMAAATCTLESAAIATVPDTVPDAEKFNAPADDTPVPDTVNGSAVVTAAPTSRVAPDVTVVPDDVEPSASAFVIFTVPVEMFVVPEYVFAFERVNVEAADVSFVIVPDPEMTPDNVWSVDDEYLNTVDVPSDTAPEYDPDPRDPAPDTITEPPASPTVRPPLNVFVPNSVNVPEPDLLSVNEPDITPEIAPVWPEATCTVESAAIATVPDTVPDAEKFNAPADDAPTPDTVNGSAVVTAAPTSKVAPDDTVVPADAAPSASACVAFKTPAETVVGPEYVFAFDNVSVPLPLLVVPPEPETTPLKVVDVPSPPDVSTAEPRVMDPAPVIDPTVSETPFRSKVPVTVTAEESGTPPDPVSWSVPAETVVVPE